MRTFIKNRFFFCLLIFSGIMTFGQESQQENSKLTRTDVEMAMKDMSDAIINGYPDKEKGGSMMISAQALKQIEDTYKKFYTLPEIEKLTNHSREWFGKLLKIVQELEKLSTEANNAAGNSQQVEKLKQLEENYGELLKVYKQTYDKPQKPK